MRIQRTAASSSRDIFSYTQVHSRSNQGRRICRQSCCTTFCWSMTIKHNGRGNQSSGFGWPAIRNVLPVVVAAGYASPIADSHRRNPVVGGPTSDWPRPSRLLESGCRTPVHQRLASAKHRTFESSGERGFGPGACRIDQLGGLVLTSDQRQTRLNTALRDSASGSAVRASSRRPPRSGWSLPSRQRYRVEHDIAHMSPPGIGASLFVRTGTSVLDVP